MRILSIFLSIIFVTNVCANPQILKTLTIPNKPIRSYIPVKLGFRHLRISSLPMQGRKIDIKKIIIKSSYIKKIEDLNLSKTDNSRLKKIVNFLKQNKIAKAKKYWIQLLQNQKNKSTPIDLDAIISKILLKTYIDSRIDIKHFASKMKALNQMKNNHREYLNELKKQAKQCRINARSCEGYMIRHISDSISAWNNKLSAINDDSQLANIDLENTLQKAQQSIQLMSNIAKNLHDTAMAIIRKIG